MELTLELLWIKSGKNVGQTVGNSKNNRPNSNERGKNVANYPENGKENLPYIVWLVFILPSTMATSAKYST